MKILFIEDDNFNREIITEHLKLWGYEVCALPDGKTFLQSLSEFQPDLILLDIKLPEIDGFTLIEKLRQSEWDKLPVVILSAYAFSAEKKRAQMLGVRRFLVKPTTPREIRRVIQAELETGG
ncbi:MAG: response regulator [Symploca sp. SIO2E9]|nr:response regulator [Symploca sp. SIO2E9]